MRLMTSNEKEKVQRLLTKTKEGVNPQFNLIKIYSDIAEIRERYKSEVIECRRILEITYKQLTDEQIKDESIPNNELNAALLGAELVQEYCFEKSKNPR